MGQSESQCDGGFPSRSVLRGARARLESAAPRALARGVWCAMSCGAGRDALLRLCAELQDGYMLHTY
jgi:hypothetical protein